MASIWDLQREHYDAHARPGVPTQVALRERDDGPSLPLKRFHNHIKRELLRRFAWSKESLLDLACGRGGDMQKWREMQIKRVKGVDISGGEIAEARRRYAEMCRKQQQGPKLNAEFEQLTTLGCDEYRDNVSYEVVTCMFAMHYFCASEASLRWFLHNVAINLRHGGYFIATYTEGRRVLAALNGQWRYTSELLTLERRWETSEPQAFGSAYVFNLHDTVTQATDHTEGSVEFLVFEEVLIDIAAGYGLFPVYDYLDHMLATNFDEEDIQSPVKHFKPFFKTSSSSLEKASSLNAAIVFQKVNGPHDVRVGGGVLCQPMRLEEREVRPVGMGRGPGLGPGPGQGQMPQGQLIRPQR